MLLATVAFVATLLTYAMFLSRNPMLGFPTAIFWALFGAQAYTLSTATWDIYFLIAFASLLGMVTFCVFAAYGLRTKKEELAEGDEYIDEGKDDMKFIDEGGNGGGEGKPSRMVAGVRDRAASRRRDGIKRKSKWGI